MSEFKHYLTSNLLIKPCERRRETGTVRSFTPFTTRDYWGWTGYLYCAYARRGLGRGQNSWLSVPSRERKKAD